MKDLAIFSTENSFYFAGLLARHLGLPGLGNMERRTFGGGEKYCRLGIGKGDLLGRDIIFVGSTHTDEDLEEMYRVGRALVGYGARRCIFVIPFLGYSTMDRAKKPGEVVTAKTVACKLSSIPNADLRNVFLLMDLHTPGLLHYFEGNCLRFELEAEDVLAEATKELKLTNFIFGSADIGGAKRNKTLAKRFQTRLVLVDKDREFEDVVVNQVIGNVSGATVIIYDDMTRSGDTLVEAAKAYRQAGAVDVVAVLSHLALNNIGVALMFKEQHAISRIITTNTHPESKSTAAVSDSSKFVVKDVSHLFAGAIKSILNY